MNEVEATLEGVASTRHMSIMYPCQFTHCQIHCPCSICHRACNRVQCKDHKILLSRLFNIETDQFTIVTSRHDELRFAVPFSGIPFSCIPCSRDLKEHQIYHLVPHTLCKYCRWQSRPLEIKSNMGPITSIAVYKDATELLEVSEEVTCATCYENEKIRKKHERCTHGGAKLACNECGLAYSNAHGPRHHMKVKHQQHVQRCCELCGSRFSSEETLKIHIKGCHGENDSVSCSYCKKRFSSESNMKRHMKETHPWCESRNIDFVDDLESLNIKCTVCDISFKRKSHLIRHMKTHTAKVEECKQKCEKCSKEFLREDNLKRHTRICSRFGCVVCHKKFSTIKDVNLHFKIVHPNGSL